MTISPSNEQWAAVTAICDWFAGEGERSSQQEFFLDGMAGTGKSFTAQFAVNELLARHDNLHVLQAAYTAKAALVMRQKGARSASTIHRLIYKADHDDNGKLNWKFWPASPLRNADLLVVDEVSMISNRVADDLRSFGKKILVLGDVQGQLPPIHGEGAFTNREPDFRLIELNRFAMEDPINQIAQRARQGARIFPAYSEGNVQIQWLSPDGIQAALYDESSPTTQLICGRHKVRWAMTRNMRRRRGIDDPSPRTGEPIICRQNNYKLGILNGQMFESTFVDDGGILEMGWTNKEDTVADDDDNFYVNEIEPVEVSRHLFDAHYADKKLEDPPFDKEVAWMDFAYAITAHSAQGSEWDHVTVIDDGDSFKWSHDLPRRWRYTAITRAAKGLTLFLRK